MPEVRVVSGSKNGKYKVLVNQIQEGIEYSSEKLAENEAKKIRSRYVR